jgi:hypothetical protein
LGLGLGLSISDSIGSLGVSNGLGLGGYCVSCVNGSGGCHHALVSCLVAFASGASAAETAVAEFVAFASSAALFCADTRSNARSFWIAHVCAQATRHVLAATGRHAAATGAQQVGLAGGYEGGEMPRRCLTLKRPGKQFSIEVISHY